MMKSGPSAEPHSNFLTIGKIDVNALPHDRELWDAIYLAAIESEATTSFQPPTLSRGASVELSRSVAEGFFGLRLQVRLQGPLEWAVALITDAELHKAWDGYSPDIRYHELARDEPTRVWASRFVSKLPAPLQDRDFVLVHVRRAAGPRLDIAYQSLALPRDVEQRWLGALDRPMTRGTFAPSMDRFERLADSTVLLTRYQLFSLGGKLSRGTPWHLLTSALKRTYLGHGHAIARFSASQARTRWISERQPDYLSKRWPPPLVPEPAEDRGTKPGS